MMRNVIVAIICFLLIMPILLRAQYHQGYNTGNGFPSNNVYHVVKDSKGLLWFCTDKGVIKYNGQKFTHYTTRNGLTDNEVFNAFEDSDKRLWFFTFNGNYCYYKNDTIYNANNDSLLRKLETASYINAMYQDAESGALYMAHINGPVRKIVKDRIITYSDSLKAYNKIRHIYRLNNRLNISTINGFYDIHNNSLRLIKRFEGESFYSGGKLITCDRYGVKIYNEDKLIWSANDADLTFSDVYDIYYYEDKYIFCGTKNGLVVYDITTDQKQKFFPNTRVTSSKADIHGNIWLSTLNKGIIKFYISNLRDVKFISMPQGAELITTKAGQNFLRDKNHLQYLHRSDTGIVLKSLWTKRDKIYDPAYINDSILIYYSPTGTRYNTDVYVYNYKYNSEKELDTVMLNRVYETGDNKLLLFLNNEIRIGQYRNNKMQILTSYIFDQVFQSEKYIKETNSLYFFDGDVFYCYKINSDQISIIDTLRDAGATKEVMYRNGRILLLIDNKTLITYAGNPLTEINRQELEVPVYNIMRINDDKYAVNTNSGYSILKIETEDAKPDIENIYFPFEQKDIFSVSPLDSDYLLFQVNDKLYYLHNSTINRKNYTPRLYLTDIRLDDLIQPPESDTLSADNKTNINVTLSPVYFGNDELTFRYRISEESNKQKWNYTNSNVINFSINSSGKYNVEFQAVSTYGFMSEPQSIYVIVTPTFFSSPLFYALLVLLLFTLVLLLFIFYSKRKKSAYRKELNYMQLQHKAVNSLLNPHFIFNAINNIQNLVNQDSKESANEYLATLSTMIRQNIENLQYELIPLKKELQLVINYIELQNLRFNGSIQYTVENTSSGSVRIPPLLIHTFVENAIVHGFEKNGSNFHISIYISEVRADYINIIIEDNGVGINHASKRKRVEKNSISLGISFNRDRLERLSKLHNVKYNLSIEDLSSITQTTGTRVSILLYNSF